VKHREPIANWLQLLKDGERAVFTAASKASQAADFLRGFNEQLEEAAQFNTPLNCGVFYLQLLPCALAC
jgi:antirestriction protein ArdC